MEECAYCGREALDKDSEGNWMCDHCISEAVWEAMQENSMDMAREQRLWG